MMKLKKAVLFSFVILSLLFTVFSTRFIMSAKASPPSEQTYYTLTLDTASKDAYIESARADTNEGADFDLHFGFDASGPSVLRVLVQFDLPPALSGANITSARLKLWGPWRWSGGYPSGEALRACRVTQDWVEGTGNGGYIQDGVTWNEYNYSDGLTTATNNWGTPGGDYTLTDSSTVTLPDPIPWGFLNWTVTNMVKGWANGTYSNCGFLIKLDNEFGTYRGGVFPSKEYAEEYGVEFAPKLEVTYTVPTIESCNSAGDQKDLFDLGETVYVTGGIYSKSTTYNFYIVVDEETWSDGMTMPQRVPDTATTVSSNINGDIPPTAVWNNPQIAGKYDIVVDVNGNGKYDAGIDALDDSDIEVTAGFVVPEFPASIILPLFVLFTVLAIALAKKRVPSA